MNIYFVEIQECKELSDEEKKSAHAKFRRFVTRQENPEKALERAMKELNLSDDDFLNANVKNAKAEGYTFLGD